MVLPKSAVTIICGKMSSRLRKTGVKGEMETYNAETDCPVPYISCVCKGWSAPIRSFHQPTGVPLPTELDGPDCGIRMRCKNDRCHLSKLLLHKKCFEQLEETLLKILSNLGSARGWTDAQLKSNLWEKKGQSLILKMLRCHCGLGLMSLDVDFYKKRELDAQNNAEEAKQRKKKCAKKNKLPALNFNNNLPVAPELLEYDYVSSRRFSHGHTSQSASALLYGYSDCESETFERKGTTPPKSSLLMEKPTQLPPAERPKHKSDEGPPKLSSIPLRQRKDIKSRKPLKLLVENQLPQQFKSTKEELELPSLMKKLVTSPPSGTVATKLKSQSANLVNGSILPTPVREHQQLKCQVQRQLTLKQQQQLLQATPTGRPPKSTPPLRSSTPLSSSATTTPAMDVPENSDKGNYYSLFDPGSHGFNLGEIILGEARLPGLINTLPRIFSHSA